MNNIIVGVMVALIIGVVIFAMIATRNKDDDKENKDDK